MWALKNEEGKLKEIWPTRAEARHLASVFGEKVVKVEVKDVKEK